MARIVPVPMKRSVRVKLENDRRVGNITGVCISRKQESWYLPEIPFFCYTKVSAGPFPRNMNRGRIEYYVQLRNEATRAALRIFPRTEHILSVESYYLNQPGQIRRLIKEYDGRSILGASTWIWDRTRVLPVARFYDTWATPEARGLKFSLVRPRGRRRVSSVGSCVLFPRFVWEMHGYGVPEPFPEAGCEYNYLCQKSGVPVWLSFEASLWRDPDTVDTPTRYPWARRVQRSFGFRRVFRE